MRQAYAAQITPALTCWTAHAGRRGWLTTPSGNGIGCERAWRVLLLLELHAAAEAGPGHEDDHHPGQDDGRRREACVILPRMCQGWAGNNYRSNKCPLTDPKNENSGSVIGGASQRQAEKCAREMTAARCFRQYNTTMQYDDFLTLQPDRKETCHEPFYRRLPVRRRAPQRGRLRPALFANRTVAHPYCIDSAALFQCWGISALMHAGHACCIARDASTDASLQ